MAILTNLAGRIGSAWQDNLVLREDASGTYFAQPSLNRGTGEKTYSVVALPSAFRTQLDIRSTASAAGARVTGGRVSAAVLADLHSVSWKSREANNVTSLRGLVNNPHPTLTITEAQYKAILAFYNMEEVVEA